MIKRHIEPAIALLVGKFPVLTITGPRQSGKTTLIRFFLERQLTTRNWFVVERWRADTAHWN